MCRDPKGNKGLVCFLSRSFSQNAWGNTVGRRAHTHVVEFAGGWWGLRWHHTKLSYPAGVWLGPESSICCYTFKGLGHMNKPPWLVGVNPGGLCISWALNPGHSDDSLQLPFVPEQRGDTQCTMSLLQHSGTGITVTPSLQGIKCAEYPGGYSLLPSSPQCYIHL